jgi:hypothetical protein
MRGSIVGRILVALVATCLVAAGLYWGFLRDGESDAARGTRVELDFSRLQNGAAPTNFDTGQPAVISQNPDDPGSNFVVRDGKLTFAPTKDGVAAAAYTTPDMGAAVTGIGARWVFEPRDDPRSGAIGLQVSRATQPQLPSVVPPVPIHFIATPINWNLSVKKDDATPLEPIAAGDFKEPLKVDGTTAYEADISIDGGRVTIKLPDGTERRVDDARVSQWRGNYASFSVWSNDGLTEAVGGFEKIWATTIPGDR